MAQSENRIFAQFGGPDFEVDNGEASRLMRHLQQFTGLKGNPTVLIVHHSAKASKKSKLAHGFRGSSAIKDNARWAAILRRVNEDDTGENFLRDAIDRNKGVLELVVAKSNYGPGFLQARCYSHDSKLSEITEERYLTEYSVLSKEESQEKNAKVLSTDNNKPVRNKGFKTK